MEVQVILLLVQMASLLLEEVVQVVSFVAPLEVQVPFEDVKNKVVNEMK